MRRVIIWAGIAALLVLTSCQAGVTMWASCTPAADGNVTGTDGTYVLICQNGEWVPLMTNAEFGATAKGDAVTIAPLPTRPTTTTTTTTVPASPAVAVSFRSTANPAFCSVVINLTNFPPSQAETVVVTFEGGNFGINPSSPWSYPGVMTDTTGAAEVVPFTYSNSPVESATFSATVNGVTSPTVLISC